VFVLEQRGHADAPEARGDRRRAQREPRQLGVAGVDPPVYRMLASSASYVCKAGVVRVVTARAAERDGRERKRNTPGNDLPSSATLRARTIDMTDRVRDALGALANVTLSVVLLLGVGCAKDPTAVLVTVDADATAPPLLILRTTVTNVDDPARRASARSVRRPTRATTLVIRPGPFVFPLDIPLTVDPSLAGVVVITVEGPGLGYARRHRHRRHVGRRDRPGHDRRLADAGGRRDRRRRGRRHGLKRALSLYQYAAHGECDGCADRSAPSPPRRRERSTAEGRRVRGPADSAGLLHLNPLPADRGARTNSCSVAESLPRLFVRTK
jgi:hypothetical protein